jgi:ELWxxDGT repeat protein
MQTNLVLFNGDDGSNGFGVRGLWVTDGTAAGTWEILAGANATQLSPGPFALSPGPFVSLGSEVLFQARDANNNNALWVTDGTSPGTSELSNFFSSIPLNVIAFGSKALFMGPDAGLWVTDGTGAGTSKLTVSGAASIGFSPSGFTAFGGKVLFAGRDTANHNNLWVTDGTGPGTSELTVTGAAPAGLSPSNFTVFGSKVLFTGNDAIGQQLWVTDGTSAGTSELTVAGTGGGGFGWLRGSFIALGSEVLFEGIDAANNAGLWVTDGTSAGTSEISVAGAFSAPIAGGVFELVPPRFARFGSEVLFEGTDNSGHFAGLWVTDGTSAGTSELTMAGASPAGIFAGITPSFFVFGSEVLFEGLDANGVTHGLWVTDGTSAGTSELTIAGAGSSFGIFSTVNPGFALFGSEVLFSGNDTHGLDGLWVTDGTSAGTSEISVTGASPFSGISPGDLTSFTQNLIRPVLSNVPGADSYTERTPPVTLAPSLHPTDDNSATFASATVAIVGGTFANDGDVLSASTSGTSISASYNSSTETLTLTGSDTLANYQQVLDSVTLSTPSHNPTDFGSDPTRAITWVVDDGAPSNNLSLPLTTTLSIVTINDPPTLSNVASNAQFTEEGAAATLANAVSIVDVDDLDLSSATVRITGGVFAGDHDVLAANTAGTGISASYNSNSETLTLTGTDTLAHYQSVLDKVTFSAGENPTDFGSNPTRSVVWTLTDPSGTSNGGVNVSTPVTSTVTITNVNDPPTLTAVATTAAVRGSQAATLSPMLTISDPDNLTLAGATVSVTGGTFPGDGDVLAATTSGTNIAVGYDAASETLTLSGTDSLAHYTQVLESVTFATSTATSAGISSHPTRTVTWSLNDGGSSNNLSTPVVTTINLQAAVPFDLNADGMSDLVFQNNGQAGVWLMNGTTPIAEAGLGNPGASWHIVTSRDVNGDGSADLIWQNSDGTPGIWLMNGTTPIAEAGFSNPGASWHIKAAGDLNGDGNADLVWQNSDGTLGVWLMNGTTPAAAAAIGNPGANWRVVGTADYNADGRDDILLQNTTTGNLMIDLMNGTTIASTVSITVGDPSWHAVSTGVFNGQAEIAWQNSDGTPGVWVMNGTAPVAEAALPNPGAAWQVLSIDHFTADGHGDLLFQNTNGAIGMWEMNGTNIVAAVGLLNAGSGWQSVNGHPFTSG